MWKDLTMQQKSEVMKMAIDQGLTDLDSIKKMYDSSISIGESSSYNNTYDYVPDYPSPKDVRYADGGELDTLKYNRFLKSLPFNQRNSTDFNTRRYWELNGKPDNFNEALKTDPPMYRMENDGLYHAGSVAYDRSKDQYEFMKAPNHPTIDLELINYWNNPEMESFRRDYGLDMDSNPYRYIRRTTTDKPLLAYGGNLFKEGGKPRRADPNANNRAMWSKAKPFYDEMLSWGIEPVAALGILGNMAQESSFLPTASNGTHHGYIQNQTSIRDFIKKQYGGYGHKEQMQYIRDGLAGKLKGQDTSMGQQLQARFNAYTTAVNGVNDPARAAYLWESTYERSGGQNNRARQNYANYFFQQARPFNVPSKYTPAQSNTPFDHSKYMQVTPSRPLSPKQIEEGLRTLGVTGFRVTSGYRSKAQQGKFKTPANLSWHPKNAAIDIVPDGISFAQLQEQLSSPSVQNFFMGSGLGVLDETSKAVQHKTGATGAHYHIGPDTSARKGYSDWVKNFAPQIDYGALNPEVAQNMLTAQYRPSIQETTTTNTIPLFTQDLQPTIKHPEIEATTTPFTFADFWDKVFPQQPQEVYSSLQEPLVNLSRMYTRPRVELKSAPLVTLTPSDNNNYVLFNSMYS